MSSEMVFAINKFYPGMLSTRELTTVMEALTEKEFVAAIAKHGCMAAFSDPRISEELEERFNVTLNQNKHRRFFNFKPEDRIVLVERIDRHGVLNYEFSKITVVEGRQAERPSFIQRLMAHAG